MRVFRNVDGRFADATAASGLTGLTGGLNMVTADYDNDGLLDVLVLRGAWMGAAGQFPMSLLRNRGGLRFDDVTKAAGLLRLRPSQTATWLDCRRRRVARSVRRQRVRRAGDRTRASCYRNNRDGTFSDDRQGVRRRPGRLRQGRRQRRLRQRRRSRHLRVGGAGRQPAAPQRRAGAARIDRLAVHQRRRPGRGGAAEEQLPGDVLRLRQRRLARSLRRALPGAAPRTSRPTTSASRPASSAAVCTGTRATARSPT